jgi:hypothetical protein
MKTSNILRMAFSLLLILQFACLAQAQMRTGNTKVLYLRTGWSNSDMDATINTFLNALREKGFDISLNVRSVNDFDGSEIVTGQYDVVYYADLGKSSSITVKESAQIAIRDFVNRGGTFVHESGITELIANKPAQYETFRELILFDKPTVQCQCGYALTAEPSSNAGSMLMAGISPIPLKNFNCHMEYANGDLHSFSDYFPELAIVNTRFGMAEKMVAVRNVGAGRVIALNFHFYYYSDYCDPKDPNLLQFYSNVFNYGRR